MKHLLSIVFVVFFSHVPAYAANPIMQAQVIDVQLNAERTEVVTKTIRVQDIESGKIAQISLQRVGKTSEFTGFFVLQFFSGDSSQRQLAFFDGPSKRPLFVKVTSDGSVQKVTLSNNEIKDVLDSNVKAESTKKIETPAAGKPVEKPKMTMAQVAVIEKEMRKKQQEEEKRILQIEEEQNMRRLELLKQQEAMSAAEKKKKKEKALAIAASADEKYRAGEFSTAVNLYEQSIELDPSEDSYVYRYGVSLYKVGQHQKALAVISTSDVDPDQATEKDYYLGLIYLKLGDNQKALKKFQDVKDEDDVQLSPAAAFLSANMYFKRQEFAEARKNAEYVLDKGSDPNMDRAAEELIEQISKLENYYASKKLKYAFTVSGGLSYDDNVLNLASNNSSTDTKAFRLNYAGTAKAIVMRTPTSDLGIQGTFNDYYSMKTSLKTDGSVQAADALEMGLNLPLNYELSFGSFQSNIEISPYYKSVWLAVGDSARKEILTQLGFTLSGGKPIRSNLLISGRLDFGQDNSKLDSSTGNDDQDASRYSLTVTPTWLLDLKGEERFAVDVGYTSNNAKGINYRNKKMQLGASLTRPGIYSAEWTYRMDYSIQDYSEATSTRKDSVLTATASLNKELRKDLSLLGSFQYTLANSDNDSYKYNKWILSSLFTWSHNILDQ